MEFSWIQLLDLAIVGAVVSAIVNWVKAKNWEWWKIQLTVAIVSLIAAGAWFWLASLGWDWNKIATSATAILVAANAIYTIFIKPLAPTWSKGR